MKRDRHHEDIATVETPDNLLNGDFKTGRLYLKPRDANMLKAATVQNAKRAGQR
jgi:hypothetical protein